MATMKHSLADSTSALDLTAVQFIISHMINSHSALHIISHQFVFMSALHFFNVSILFAFCSHVYSDSLESKDCLALLLCNSIAYLRLPEIILSNVLFLDLFPAGILYCFIITDHRYDYHKFRPWSPGKSGY